MSGRLRREDADGVRTLTLDRVAKKNAIDGALAGALAEALEAAEGDDAVRAVVVGAAGDVFTAGADVSLFLAVARGETREGQVVASLPAKLRAFTKPLFAAVQGPAVGMGVTMLPHFDAVYAAPEATFTLPFVRLGLVQEFGSSWTLPRLIGHQRAAELIFRAAPLDAPTAERWGLVTRVFRRATLADEVQRIAAEVARASLPTLRHAKALLRGADERTLQQTWDAEEEVLAGLYGSPENVAAVQAFFARRRRG